MSRSLNNLSGNVVVNTNNIVSGTAIDINGTTTSNEYTADLNISKATTSTTIATTDLLVYQTSGADTEKITFGNFVSSLASSGLLLGGKGIDIFDTGSGQFSINVGMKENTTEQTNVNSNDWLLVADNSTGKVIKRVLFSTLNGSMTRYWIREDGTTVFLNDFNTDDVVIGDYQMSGSERFRVVGNSLFNGNIETDNTIIDNGGYLQINELNSNGSNYKTERSR